MGIFEQLFGPVKGGGGDLNKNFQKFKCSYANPRQLCKPSTLSRVCITVSNSPNPSRVYIRLCKHGKRFLLLKHQTHYEKSDWSRAFNQFTIACELDMRNALSAADIAFIMSSSMSAWLLSPFECFPQKQNG